jgi:phosphoserine phosphatase
MLKLAVFDLDGTLKQAPNPYAYLHRRLGTLEAAEAFTARGLSGEIDYEEWLRLDASLWRDTPRSVIERLLRENPYQRPAPPRRDGRCRTGYRPGLWQRDLFR